MKYFRIASSRICPMEKILKSIFSMKNFSPICCPDYFHRVVNRLFQTVVKITVICDGNAVKVMSPLWVVLVCKL